MQVGTGKSVLNGIAIGKLKIYKKKDTTISTTPVTDTGAELLRFEDAQQKAIQQQTALYEKALAEAGEDIAEVFNIHAMMLEDDDFVDAIKEIITKQKMCAEYAVKTAGTNQAAVFAARAPSPPSWWPRTWPRPRRCGWTRACCWALSPGRAAPTATPPSWPAA